MTIVVVLALLVVDVPLTLVVVLVLVANVERAAVVEVLLKGGFVIPGVGLGAGFAADVERMRFVVFFVSFSAADLADAGITLRDADVVVVVVRGAEVGRVVVFLIVPSASLLLSGLSVLLLGAVTGLFVIVLVVGVGRAGAGLLAEALGLLNEALGAVGVGGLGVIFLSVLVDSDDVVDNLGVAVL